MDEQVKFYELYNINAITIKEYENTDIGSAFSDGRVRNALCRGGIMTVGALLNCTNEKLATIKGFGTGCFNEVHDFFESLHLEEKVIESKVESTILYAEKSIEDEFSVVISESTEVVGLFGEEDTSYQELLEQCKANPVYMVLLNRTLKGYCEINKKLKTVIESIPFARRHRKARLYIDACSSESTGKAALLTKLQHENESLEKFVRTNANELCDDKSIFARFVKQCNYDIYNQTSLFFDEIKVNERAYDIIRLRSEGKTLELVGNVYSLTRERIRQIEKKISRRFISWEKHNKIMYKIVADEDGNSVLLPSVFNKYFNEYAGIIIFFFKVYGDELEYVHYYKTRDLFLIGDDSVLIRAQEYIDNLPDIFNKEKLCEHLDIAYEKYGLSKELMSSCIEYDFKKTGDVYHRSPLTYAKIYSDVLANHYPNGIWIYSNDELEEFKKHILDDYGDIMLPENNRAFIGRISSVGVLCGRGMYGPKKEKYISDELANKIHSYINDSEFPIFMTNTIFSLFKEELIEEGVTNKYYLQGILKELYNTEYYFRKDYISKDNNLTSVYSEIIEFIERANYPVTKQQISVAFPGITDIVINISVSDSEIINLFGTYIHAKKLSLNRHDLFYLNKVMTKMLDKTNFIHCRDIYEYVLTDYPNILTGNSIYQAFGFYSVLEYLYQEEYEFSRPYIGRKGIEITRTFDQLHEMVQASDIIQLADIVAVARENHFQINSILEFANSCNETHLLANDKELVALEYAGVTEEIADTVLHIINEEITNTVYILDLQCVNRFPKINIPWSEWLIYSMVNKWGSTLESGVTSTTFKHAKALVAPIGSMNIEGVDDRESSDKIYLPDNLENIDDLIVDMIFEEIEG